ncbi:Inositol polyphosphate 4-phosphatase type II [Galemys pyrenaicus]|uniref:Inositol polyphosphate 4-phosphatase type II n=1 Tax=Galemys pyrenaicus TaxID=202257 RepID=A0A8J6AGH7_GALPY|nr:Inositol polyphosphate 4-phosphatase type II [Galemys pyrenaicus]
MGETEDGEADHITTDVQGQKCALVCECTAPESVSAKDNLPFLNSVLKNPVCKLYRFPTSDNKWMRIREQMSESILSFHIPKELISLHIKEDLCRNQELKELGELSPHWDNLRKNVLTHCDQMVNMYQDILTELNKETGSSFKSSSSKGEKTLEFVPVNLHLQRMHVHSPHLKVIPAKLKRTISQTSHSVCMLQCKQHAVNECGKVFISLSLLVPDALYDVITVGAPAAHFQGFKNGGLRKLLHRFEMERRNTGYQFIYYSPENTAKAKEVLSNINQLQPLTELFVHAFKDQLVRSALLALYTARPGGVFQKPPSPENSTEEGSPQDAPPPVRRQDSIPHHSDYDEEEWDRVWANVGKSLNCIIAMVDKLIETDGKSEDSGSNKDGDKDPSLVDAIITHPEEDWYEQLYPLILTLKDCMREVVSRAKQSLTFVLLQELAYSLPQCLMLTLRRDVVFSQALAGLVCGFIIKIHTSLHDPGFLQQLRTVGLIVQYEGLLSTYSDEIGMLEDMAVGISDLKKVTFKIIEAKSNDVLPVITGRREHYVVEVKLPARMFESLPLQIKEGQLLHVHPVLFNVGINEQQTLAERACWAIVLMLQICRKLNGIRFTCCKSAKDRTSMSVTLEQCSILRDEHRLHKDFFTRALDCMRRCSQSEKRAKGLE